MRSNKLATLMMGLLLISILISLFSIYTIYKNKEELLQSVERNVRSQLAAYDIPTSEDLQIDDARILLAVAKYCETRNDCTGHTGSSGPLGPVGQTGAQGIPGIIGLTGTPGRDGEDGKDGYTPQKNVDYFDGQDGVDGTNGRNIEQRCNHNRVEWRYEGDENWTPLYNLSPLQSCAAGA